MRYWPLPSVTADRIFSINASLPASTVTPGRTAPELSRTVPVSDAWAKVLAGTLNTASNVSTPPHCIRMSSSSVSPPQLRWVGRAESRQAVEPRTLHKSGYA